MTLTFETVKDNVEWIAAALALLGTMFAGAGTLAVWLWKLSQWIKSLEESKAHREEREKHLSDAIKGLEVAVIEMRVKLEEREKDTNQVVGAIETTRKDLVGVIKEFAMMNGSLQKLWTTVEAKPVRFSDRGPKG